MKHITCDQCGKTFSHPTRTRVERELRLHMQRTHLGTTTPPGTRSAYPNGKDQPQAGQPIYGPDPLAEKVERRGKWKRKAKVEVSVNFCPACGCDMHAVALGIAMARKA